MTKEECEAKILEKLKEIDTIHKEYNPNANYLSLCINDGYMFNNEYWSVDEDNEDNKGKDADYPIHFAELKEDEEDGEN